MKVHEAENLRQRIDQHANTFYKGFLQNDLKAALAKMTDASELPSGFLQQTPLRGTFRGVTFANILSDIPTHSSGFPEALKEELSNFVAAHSAQQGMEGRG